MGIFFWDFSDVNDIVREWAMFMINLGAFLFTLYSLIKTAKYHNKILFELLPLSINTIATLILLFIKLFQKGYEFDMVGYVIEIFTYFLFCYTFSVMHSKIIAKHRHSQLLKICNIILVLLAIIVVVFIALIISSVIVKDCDNDLKQASIAGFITELASYIPTIYFGLDIIQRITKKHEEQKAQSAQEIFIFNPVSDQYIRQRKKQIKLVLGAYTISLVLRAVILILNLSLSSYFNCINCDGVKIITSDSIIGQIILVLIQVNQLIPHLIIPIALYVVPVKQSRRSADLTIQNTLLVDDTDQSHHIQASIQRKVSTSILKRSFSPQKKTLSDTDTQK